MTSADETRPLMQGGGPTAVIVQGYSSHARMQKPPGDRKITLKGVVSIFFAAIIVFLLAALTSRTILWEDSTASSDTDESATTSRFEYEDVGGYPAAAAAAAIYSGHGLVNPKNGTHPTQTSTQQCTGDSSFPVLAGADVVAYFQMEAGSKPVIARGEVRSTYRDYVFYFSSLENRAIFESDPEKYMPAWGGFCSYGVAVERVWTSNNLGPFADPSKWKILTDGRLHVFRSDVPMKKFSLSVPEYLQAGDTNWDTWFKGGTGPLNTACFCSKTLCNDA